MPAQSTIDRLCRVPKNKALFWSGSATTILYPYRDQIGLVTDKTAYPAGYTERYRNPDGSQRDPIKDRLFAKRFSMAFAKKATGEVRLIVPWETGPNPNRFFHSVEWPVLKRSLARGRVTKIIQVNPSNVQETREYDPRRYGLSKRAESMLSKRAVEIDFDNIPWDADLDAVAERWRQVHKNTKPPRL